VRDALELATRACQVLQRWRPGTTTGADAEAEADTQPGMSWVHPAYKGEALRCLLCSVSYSGWRIDE